MSWLAEQTAAWDAAQIAAGLAVNWLIQSTLLIAAGLAAARLLSHRGSAAQSAVYRTTLLAVALCPLASLVLSFSGFSGWSVTMPTAYTISAAPPMEATIAASPSPPQPQASSDVVAPPLMATERGFEDALPHAPAFVDAETPASFGDAFANQTAAAQPAALPSDDAADNIAAVEPVGAAAPAPSDKIAVHRFGILALTGGVIWLLAAAALLARLAVAWRRLQRLRRGASPAAAATTEVCRDLARRMMIEPPAVLHSPYLPSPCLAGVLRPAIMLPDEEPEQPAQSVHDVLVHELAHLRRHDCLWNLVRRATTAVLWFQPLLWVLSRRLEASAEEVCDDYVVQLGGDRQHYARRLVDIAELSATPFAAAGVAMVSIRSMLERRVTRVMDTSRSLSTRVGNVLLVLLLAGGAIGTLAAGLVGVGEHVSAADSDSADADPQITQSNDSSAEAGEKTALSPADGDDQEDSAKEPPLHRRITGRVVDEHGAPIAGASVKAVRMYIQKSQRHLLERSFQPIGETRTGSTGEFELEFDGVDAAVEKDKQGWLLVANAPGHGPAWTDNNHLYKMSTATLKLPPDRPIRGRIVDLEGRPVVGVRVRVDELWTAESDQAVSDWINEVKASPPPAINDRDLWFSNSPRFPIEWRYGKLEDGAVGLPQAAVTDTEGRFQLTDVGADRLALLKIEGERVATALIPVVTRETEPFEARPSDSTGARSNTHYGAQVELVAEPTQLVEGEARDAETGEPIPGIEIRLERYADNTMSQEGFLSTRTDANGRYRLRGLPSGGGHTLGVAPTVEQSYFHTKLDLPKVATDAGSIKCDFELRRGQWITGKVVERGSGEPIPGAVVEYLPLRSNKHAPDYANYDPRITGQVPSERFHADENGEFRVLAIPGPGLVAAIVERKLREEFAPLWPGDLPEHLVDDSGHLNAYAPWTITGYYALQEVDLTAGEQPEGLRLECRRGDAREVTFVDADGQPVAGLQVLGRKFPPQLEPALEGASTTLVGLREDEERIVVALHPERRVGRALKIAAGEPLTVDVQPCAIARGRLVNEDGQPLAKLDIGVRIEGPDSWARRLEDTTTDADGRFELLLPPGLPMRVAHYSTDINISAECVAKPGAVFELGDLRDGDKLTAEQTAGMLQVAAKVAQPKEPNEGAEALEFAGSVVTPDGQAAVAADLYLVYHLPEPTGLLTPSQKPVATTDAAGRFRFKSDAEQAEHAALVAVKEGYGFAWSQAAVYEASGRLLEEAKANAAKADESNREYFAKLLKQAGQPLKLLSDDEPIRGRVVDINGQPVAGVKLTLREVYASLDGNLDAWRAAAAEEKADYYSARLATPLFMNGPHVRSLARPATTDAQGRFKLPGVGKGRIAELLVESPGIETAKLLVRTEAGEPIELERERRSPHGKYIYHPAEFTHVAAPSVRIAGVVRDAKTGQPLAGVTVKSQSRHGEEIHGWGQDFVRAVTDEEGRYQLTGMPIGDENEIAAIAPDDGPYLSMAHQAATSTGQESITVDFDLNRGLWLEGRATDARTGEGVAGRLRYYVHQENPHYKLARQMDVDERDRLQTDKEGHFRIVVLPGRGFIAFSAHDHEPFGRATSIQLADGGEQQPADRYMTDTGPSYLMVANYHVVAEIIPAEEAERHELNLELDSGKTVVGHVVDAQGKPVTGFYYSGQLAQFESWRPGEGDSFQINGYEPTAPRHVYLFHEERNLAAHVTISGEPPTDLKVELQPAGTIKGRLIDGDGEPLAGYVLHRWSAPIIAPDDFKKQVDRAPPLPPSNRHTQVGEHETDAEGRFEIAGLAPGVEYRISAFDRDSMRLIGRRTPRPSGTLGRVIVVEPGQTLDLGDVKLADDDEFAAAAEKPDEAAAPAAAAPQEKQPAADAMPVSGRIVGADGKPVAGAKIHWITWSTRGPQPDPILVATTDAAGAYKFTPPGMGQDSNDAAVHNQTHQIVVTAPGHGMQILMPGDLQPRQQNLLQTVAQAFGADAQQQPVLGLPKEGLIKGRIIDVDGQPVAGARITLRRLSRDRPYDIEEGIKALNARGESENAALWARALSMTNYFFPQRLAEVAPSATADADGRFELKGIGADAIVELLVEGPGVQSDLIQVRTLPGETLVLKADGNGRYDDRTLHGPEFTHVAGPSKPIEGRVLDFDSGAPIAGATVRTYKIHGDSLNSSRDRWHLAAVTDAEGRYRISGLPVGSNQLVAFTTGDEPYVPMGATADTSTAGAALTLDIRLKRGVWAEGKVYDAESRAPLMAELTYYLFPTDELKDQLPGLRHAYVDEHYFARGDGSFRVPVLASRGILALRQFDSGFSNKVYPRGVGADGIEGLDRESGIPQFATWPHYLNPQNYHAMKQVAPSGEQSSIKVDFPLSMGGEVIVEPVDENGKALVGVEYYGRTDSYGWEKTTAASCKVENLAPGRSRKVIFYHRERNLAGAAIVNEDTEDGLKVTLTPAASVRGRLVDEEGVTITDAKLLPDLEQYRDDDRTLIWPADPEAVANRTTVPAKGGEFRIVGLVAGWRYSSWASAPRKLDGRMTSMGIGRVFDDLELQPGEERDLGQLLVTYDQEKRKAASENRSAASAAESGPPAAENKDAEDPSAGEDQSSSDAKGRELRVHGQIRGPDGEPAAGVDVAVVSLPITVQRGGEFRPRGAVLFETTTDAEGRYELTVTGLSPDTHRYTSLIARAAGLGLAWKRLDVSLTETEVSFDLQPEAPLTVQLVDIEGQPAAGMQVNVKAVMPTIVDNRPPTEGVFFQDVQRAPRAWFESLTSDDQGRITLRNVAAGHGVSLQVEGSDRFAPQDIAVNTGMPEQRGERDGTYRSQVVNNVGRDSVPAIPLAPAQLFTGVVRYEDTGEPAPHARVTIWASQQEFGSMMSVAGVADGEGRYRITPQPGIRFGVTAFPPDGAPYMARELEPVRWDAGDESKQVDVTLPRGVLVRGQVVDGKSDQPIAGAAVQFVAEQATGNAVPKGAVTGWQNRQVTGDDGRFNIVVPPGPGRLLVHAPRNEYVIIQTSSRELYEGRPGGERNYAHAIERIESAPNAGPLEVTLRLNPAEKVSGELVDVEGQPIESALVITRLTIHANWLDWHASTALQATNGRFELTGLAPGEEYPVLFLDQKRKLGALATLRAGIESPRIELTPCGRATMRFVDPEGQPISGISPSVHLVVTPGSFQFDTEARKRGELAADADFISNIDRLNHPGNEQTDAEGRLEVGALIPGATYRVVHGGGAGKELQSTDFVVKSGETVDAGEFTLDLGK